MKKIPVEIEEEQMAGAKGGEINEERGRTKRSK
jgi:hypothetical protein